MITEDIQRLEVGEIIELFEVDATVLGGEIYRFHGYAAEEIITWQGLEYSPWPLEATGFAMSGQGRMPTPNLKLGNVGGFITALVVFFNDLVGATVIRRRTLGKYLDGRPEANPTEEFPPELWYVEQKAGEGLGSRDLRAKQRSQLPRRATPPSTDRGEQLPMAVSRRRLWLQRPASGGRVRYHHNGCS